jgi:hypothetical protein
VKNGIAAIGWMWRTWLIPLIAFASSAAWADDSSSRWSLGMQLGQARGQTGSDSAQLEDELSPMSYDMAATVGGSNRFGWRVFTGYRFTNYLAIHVGYTDLGESQSRLVENAMIFSERMPTFERVGIQSVRGVDVGLQLKLPVTERISVDAHGGRYYWQSNTRIEGLWSEVDRDAPRTKQRDSDAFYGVGVEVGVMHDLSATLGWTRYQVDREPVVLWTVGALYRFGFY